MVGVEFCVLLLGGSLSPLNPLNPLSSLNLVGACAFRKDCGRVQGFNIHKMIHAMLPPSRTPAQRKAPTSEIRVTERAGERKWRKWREGRREGGMEGRSE